MFEQIEETQNTPKQFLVYLSAMAIGFYWSGCVFATLWEWFIFPVIPVRQISVPEAIGIILIAGLLLGKRSIEKKSDLTWELIQDRMIDWTMRPLVALACGSIVHYFV